MAPFYWLRRYDIADNLALVGYYAASSVIYYLHFGTTYWSHLQGGFLTPEDGTDTLSRNVGKNYNY